MDRFRYGARDIQTQTVGGETRTVVIRPDGTQVITVVGRDGQLLRRIRRDERGREIIIIDNRPRSRRGPGGGLRRPGAAGGAHPADRYIVEAAAVGITAAVDLRRADGAAGEAVRRGRYSLDEIRYSPSLRERMPRVDLDTITFEFGSWEIPPDQAGRLPVIADGLNRRSSR